MHAGLPMTASHRAGQLGSLLGKLGVQGPLPLPLLFVPHDLEKPSVKMCTDVQTGMYAFSDGGDSVQPPEWYVTTDIVPTDAPPGTRLVQRQELPG